MFRPVNFAAARDISKRAAAALASVVTASSGGAQAQERRHSITVCESPSQPVAPSSPGDPAPAGSTSYLPTFNPSAFMSMAMEAVTNFMESGDTSTNPVSNSMRMRVSGVQRHRVILCRFAAQTLTWVCFGNLVGASYGEEDDCPRTET